MQKQMLILVTLVVSAGVVHPVFAQNPTQNEQPITGTLHKREAALKTRIKALYKAGRIDDTANANYQRDLDAICDREEELRSKDVGFTDKARAEINEKLDKFEARVASQETQK